MPHVTISLQNGSPLINMFVGLSGPHVDAMLRSGKTPPQMVVGSFLIDTGASHTCVDDELVKPLGLVPTGAVGIQTPSTAGQNHFCNQYDTMLIIPTDVMGDAPFILTAAPVIETSLRSQGIDGLIGRDVLEHCILIYNGRTATYTLSY